MGRCMPKITLFDKSIIMATYNFKKENISM